MTNLRLFSLILAFVLPSIVMAEDDDVVPTISPYGTIISTGDDEGKTVSDTYSGNAPLEVTFSPGEENVGSCTEYYEWRFYMNNGSAEDPYLIRHEKETTMTFTESGTHYVVLYAYFTQGTDTIVKYTKEYWDENTDKALAFTISESKLEIPNAFSPNGDGNNDIFMAKKDSYQSIVEFHATIYNRWGQKLYHWDDITGGWDGKYNGHVVKDGVYYVAVDAKGADGRIYKIRRDVNVLKGLNKSTGESEDTSGDE